MRKSQKVEKKPYLLEQQSLHMSFCTFIKLVPVDDVNCDDGSHDFSKAGHFPLVSLSEANEFVSFLVVEAPAR